ncbi:hypothetical protein SAMN02910456_00442 [Ruminococcaceae bacterium YRB3002]|nr:hypothetical protein SAMN02910456_00442 [Ruminococcaceae bacterium YRB3002]
MDKAIYTLRRFGLDYKHIPAGYVRNQIAAQMAGCDMGEKMDLEYMHLLYGYMLTVGDSGDVPFLESHLGELNDPVLNEWTNALASGDECKRKEAVKDFEQEFDKYLRSVPGDMMIGRTRNDRWFAAWCVIAFMSIVPMIFLYPGFSTIKIDELPVIVGCFMSSMFWAAAAIIRVRQLIPVGFERSRKRCLIWAALLGVGVLFCGISLYCLLCLQTVDRIRAVALALFLFPGAVMLITGAVMENNSIRSRSHISVEAVVIEHKVVQTQFGKSYRPVFEYSVNDVTYRREMNSGQSFSLKTINRDYAVGSTKVLSVDSYSPAVIYTNNHDGGAAVMLAVTAVLLLAAIVVIVVFS